MRSFLRVAALFVVYSGIGFGGDYAVSLLAEEAQDEFDFRFENDFEPEVDVRVEIDPEIVVDVQVRHSGECSYQAGQRLSIPVGPGDVLSINAGSGELRVEGREGLDEVVVMAEACASAQEWLEELRVSAEQVSGGVSLQTHYPERRNWRGDNTAKIDLTIQLPLGMVVDIDDSSGDIEVTGTGDLNIDDSSGSIEVRGILGSVNIDDSSGGLDVFDVSGDVSIEDGSGGLDVRDVRGSVAVRDGSGGIDISEVGIDVLIEADGSGGIDVRGIGGDFVVDRDGSGGIRHSDVGGRVDIPEDQRRRRRRPGR